MDSSVKVEIRADESQCLGDSWRHARNHAAGDVSGGSMASRPERAISSCLTEASFA